ncbi:aspartyl-tRNA synthetase [Aeropyrum pernix K1]|uniref:Aspartate--tRNA(Asp/Asn) ligase n=1 Tax=Aeropyrum pernix (strain ATCC 700893 / DSM 11879 / JCM 9820 / NBRC 100138 / K1) TaxID=272557 RepID=SYDND_AERPE|nr:aspartate--tRNA(Asn) ligase [Aeropyrum pernix]Q9Y9U7.2 RecName: Full=Aspartate--tRNA(Asp/Asn) ligase; AltName: Full=Aspartyl-tRNA synthetase; Short=AspRS; AltName: Full=Non-discriminating aspartyl-tRNA synthetase; Short=ND-AspRS [Aeropyrum pernix K1]BAA81203.2 aspartyl-tRNA synthetase [Aeropyrum pernix K1]
MLKDRFIADIIASKESLVGGRVRVCGWAYRIRDLGRLKFILVRDRSGVIQATVKRGESPEDALRAAEDLKLESVVCVEGELRQAPTREGVEVKVERLEVLSTPVEPLPLEVEGSEKASLPTRLKYRWLDIRNPMVSAIFELEAMVAKVFRDYYWSQGFVEIFTPKIVAAGTESGAEVFPVVYFDKTAFLAQSPQFYKQFAVIAGLERVFEIGPVFRAEPHHTSRHLNEYHSLDIEVGFIESYNDVMNYVEGFMRAIVRMLEEDGRRVLELYGVELPRIPASGIPKIPLRKAYEILEEKYGKKVEYGEDLDSEGERLMGAYAGEELDSDFVFIVEYPWKVRPFYTMRKDDEPSWTYSFDLLYRGLEIVTGGQREHRYHRLLENLRDKGLDAESFQFYLDFFKHGAPPHGGAGMGLERIVMQTLKLENIREARMLPRDTERITP